MPCHFGDPEKHIFTQSSPTGSQFLPAAGAANAGRIYESVRALSFETDQYATDEMVLMTTGDGATSEGEFWEALNTITTEQLPVLILVQDNGYAISTPVEAQTPGGSISKAFASLPGLTIFEVDGCDVLATWDTMVRAYDHIRARKGPVMVHAHVIRPYSHSMSDDESGYRTQEERQADAERDPIVTFANFLTDQEILSAEGLAELKAEVDEEVQQATDTALAAPAPRVETVDHYIYSPDVDPTSDEFVIEPVFTGTERTMIDLINACLHSEMARDPHIVVFGEDVADITRSQHLDSVKGKGGVFKATHGLQRAFGDARVFNSPLAEANIIGRAIGMAARGLKPVVEIQFFDYIWPAYEQIRNELATIRWRSDNAFSAPMVIRVPIGGYLKGGAPYHSQSGEVLFAHIPGLRVVMPSNALDAMGLLRTAIRCDDPVMFLEPKHLYRQTYNKSAEPGPDFTIPFGKARIIREGRDLTVVTYGSLVHRTLKALVQLEPDDIDVEIIDLRSLNPYDWDAIATSVKKTNKVIVAHEDCQSWGYGAEIASRIADELFEYLDGPVRRIGAMDSFVAYHPDLENAILPQVDDIATAIRALASY
jgi:2-oxoisovalerate dehydrogenase E1 component